MGPLDLVNLTPLVERTSGRPEIKVGLIDGPVVIDHPELAIESILEVPGKLSGVCAQASSAACMHGTFVSGILCAKRSSPAPAICPNCTLLVRPIFAETKLANGEMPSATPEELTLAILDCIDAGARVLNVSAALAQPSIKNERALEDALTHAAMRGVIVVVAAGNQGILGSTAITSHPWVIPVAGYDLQGRPMNHSNLGSSIGRWGLGAPGDQITSLGAEGKPLTLGGTSARRTFYDRGDCVAVVRISQCLRYRYKARHHSALFTTAEHCGSAAARCLDVVSVPTNHKHKGKIQ